MNVEVRKTGAYVQLFNKTTADTFSLSLWEVRGVINGLLDVIELTKETNDGYLRIQEESNQLRAKIKAFQGSLESLYESVVE